jgi:hypothetical protein
LGPESTSIVNEIRNLPSGDKVYRLLELFFEEVDDIPVGYHAQDNTHCLPANFHVNTRLRSYKQQKESSKAKNLE